jgi:hypothetical protein
VHSDSKFSIAASSEVDIHHLHPLLRIEKLTAVAASQSLSTSNHFHTQPHNTVNMGYAGINPHRDTRAVTDSGTVRRRLISTSSLSATSTPASRPPQAVSCTPSAPAIGIFAHRISRLDLQVRWYRQAYDREVREGEIHSINMSPSLVLRSSCSLPPPFNGWWGRKFLVGAEVTQIAITSQHGLRHHDFTSLPHQRKHATATCSILRFFIHC